MSNNLRTVVLHKRSDQQGFGAYISDDVPSGLYVVTVEPNSPAWEANVQPGDRIVAINGQSVSSMHGNLKEMITNLAQNAQTLTLSVKSTNVLDDFRTVPTNPSSNTRNDLPTSSTSKYGYYDYQDTENTNNGISPHLERSFFI